MSKKFHSSIKKGEYVDKITLRVTREGHLEYSKVFENNLIWYISCMEGGSLPNAPQPHTHAAIILAKALSRDQIVARLKKHYSDLVGNHSFSLGKWDGREEYLRYICKDVINHELYKVERCVHKGTPPINFTSPKELCRVYWEINRALKDAGKAAVAKSENMEDFIIKNIHDRYKPDVLETLSNQRRRELIVQLSWEYFDHYGKVYHGNDFQFESFLNRVEHKAFAKVQSYKNFFIEKFKHRR